VPVCGRRVVEKAAEWATESVWCRITGNLGRGCDRCKKGRRGGGGRGCPQLPPIPAPLSPIGCPPNSVAGVTRVRQGLRSERVAAPRGRAVAAVVLDDVRMVDCGQGGNLALELRQLPRLLLRPMGRPPAAVAQPPPPTPAVLLGSGYCPSGRSAENRSDKFT